MSHFLRAGAIGLALAAGLTSMNQDPEPDPRVARFSLDDLRARRTESGRAYLPFLDVPDLSCGLYELAAGSEDPQSPHDRDEVYVVMAGRGQVELDGESQPVASGDVIYVAKDVAHRFHHIEEDLSLMVVFAPGPKGH